MKLKEIDKNLLYELFNDEIKCLEFISDVKWESGYVCHKCGNTNYCKGKLPFSRRCTRCKTEESATNGTIFHHCKFPINKAFYILYNVCKENKDISTYEFARRLSLRQMTCWKFKSKIIKAIKDLGEKPNKWSDLF